MIKYVFKFFFTKMVPYPYGDTHTQNSAKFVGRVLKELWNEIDCHRLISSISCLPLLTFFSKYESSEMKPYVVSRNQLNSRGTAESYCSRGGSRKTGVLKRCT